MERPRYLEPLLSQAEVLHLVGVCRETLYRWRRKGLFPEPIQINYRGDLGWRESEVHAWLNRRDQEGLDR